MQTHAGDFRHRIQIQRSQKVQEHGYTKDMFLPYKNVWAKANNLYGNEKWAAAELWELESPTPKCIWKIKQG